MRVVPFTPLIAAAALFACSTFSDGADDPPPPNDDGGPPATPDGGGDRCTPILFDPAAGSACPGVDLTQAQNCGACGHACVDSPCVEGRCEREQLTGALPAVAFIGNYAYAPIAGTSKIARADLSKRPVEFIAYFDNLTGTVNHLESYADELYIGWDNDQTILKPGDEPDAGAKPRVNDGFDAVKTTETKGHYYPGATSYYLFPDMTAGVNLARIGPDKAVDLKRENDFLPIARNGDAIYWTKKQGSAASIIGPWERANETVAIVDGAIEAFAAEGDTVFVASGGYVSRATRGASSVARLAIEPGVGVAFAIDGDQLFYAVRRTVSGEDRYYLYRVDKCAGGEPVPLIAINQPITAIYLHEKTHVTVNTASGLFRTRR